MSSPVVALLLGLALLAIAAWLLLKQRSQGGAGSSFSSIPTPSGDHRRSSLAKKQSAPAASSEAAAETSANSAEPVQENHAVDDLDTEYLGLEPDTAPTEAQEEIIATTPAGVLEIDRSAAHFGGRSVDTDAEQQQEPAQGEQPQPEQGSGAPQAAGASGDSTSTGSAGASAAGVAIAGTAAASTAAAVTAASVSESAGAASADGNGAGEQPAAGATETVTTASPRQFEGLTGGRRRRRAWAQAHEYEYEKSDAHVTETWPRLVIGRGEHEDGAYPVARDVVSGFFRGYPVTIGEVNRSMVLAMRRAEPSPAHIVYSTRGELPHGLRRAERSDRGPYFAFTNDTRALDRMLDDRVLDALAALSQVADHIEWEGRWLYIRISRKLDTSVWDQILPHQFHMANAAMVLPPMYANIPLEFDRADQTRAIPGSNWSIATARDSHFEMPAGATEEEQLVADAEEPVGEAAGAAPGSAADAENASPEGAADSAEDNPTREARPGYLRAVPHSADEAASDADAVGEDPTSEDSNSADREGTDAAASGTADEGYAAHSEVPDSENPDITRPAAKVEFPSRSHSRTEGDMEDYSYSHLSEETHTLPKLGEDPEHIRPSTAQRAHVLRADADEKATIFDDVDEPDVEYVDLEFDNPESEMTSSASGDKEDSLRAADMLAQRREAAGRHRAPDARHARPDPIEPVEIETVDAEIVDINHNKKD